MKFLTASLEIGTHDTGFSANKGPGNLTPNTSCLPDRFSCVMQFSVATLIAWVYPEDYCRKNPCNFSTEMFVSKVGNPCPSIGQILASRIFVRSW